MNAQRSALTFHSPVQPIHNRTHHDKIRQNTFSWSSASSTFSLSSQSTFSSIATSVMQDNLDGLYSTEDSNDLDTWNLSPTTVIRALSRAASQGDCTLVNQILSDTRARPFLNIDSSDDDTVGTTPLIYAACFGKPEVARVLLAAGAKVDVQDKMGWTPLMWATTNNHPQVVQLLLDHGASFATKSARGRTAADFVDGANPTMVTILSHKEGRVPTKKRHLGSFGEQGTTDTVDHPDMQTNQKTDHALDSGSSEDEDLVMYEANWESVHRFKWDICLPDQMFVFAEHDMETILNTAIVGFKQPRSHLEIWVPANIVFLSARYAHYVSSAELLKTFLKASIAKIAMVIKLAERDIHMLVFWISNLSQLLFYLKKDFGLVVATAEHQLAIAELISETYTLLVKDSEQRLDKILEPAMLEYEQITGLEPVDFTDDWSRYFRRSRTRKATSTGPLEPLSDQQYLPHTLTPHSITSMLSSILHVFRSYEVHPLITAQATAQFFHFFTCEMFNRILMNKKYMCRSKALQIRMNLSVVEEWVHDNGFQGAVSPFFGPLIQLLQLLQCVSQLDDLELFVKTTKTFDLLNPVQIKRCVLQYRYEVSETRLPDEIEKYTMQIAQDTVRSVHQKTLQRQSSESSHGCGGQQSEAASRRSSFLSSGRPSVARQSRGSRPNSISSIGSLLILSGMMSREATETEEEVVGPSDESIEHTLNDEDEDEAESAREWVAEKRDSSFQLPFTLPTSKPVRTNSNNGTRPIDPENELPSRHTLSEGIYQALKQKRGAERERDAGERSVVPSIPEDWLEILDSKMHHQPIVPRSGMDAGI
ncbi:hypothetical protein CLU79DRAFT_840745 [Phycomyces nitens]|nr:hypothetical protein CLU79DRAFT_840745 [Phycomyces nitens]